MNLLYFVNSMEKMSGGVTIHLMPITYDKEYLAGLVGYGPCTFSLTIAEAKKMFVGQRVELAVNWTLDQENQSGYSLSQKVDGLPVDGDHTNEEDMG